VQAPRATLLKEGNINTSVAMRTYAIASYSHTLNLYCTRAAGEVTTTTSR